jgi:hypothetical protein
MCCLIYELVHWCALHDRFLPQSNMGSKLPRHSACPVKRAWHVAERFSVWKGRVSQRSDRGMHREHESCNTLYQQPATIRESLKVFNRRSNNLTTWSRKQDQNVCFFMPLPWILWEPYYLNIWHSSKWTVLFSVFQSSLAQTSAWNQIFQARLNQRVDRFHIQFFCARTKPTKHRANQFMFLRLYVYSFLFHFPFFSTSFFSTSFLHIFSYFLLPHS